MRYLVLEARLVNRDDVSTRLIDVRSKMYPGAIMSFNKEEVDAMHKAIHQGTEPEWVELRLLK
jgi:hypothetical protein